MQIISFAFRREISLKQMELTRSSRGSSAASKSRRRCSRKTTRWETTEATRGRWWSANASNRASKANRKTSSSGLAYSWASSKSSSCSCSAGHTCSKSRGWFGGRWAINGAGHDVGTAHNCETEGPLLFRFDQGSIRRSSSWLGLALDAAEFFCVCEYEVHVL